MRVLGRDKLDKFGRKQARARNALQTWYHEVSDETCCWQTPQDIKDRYSSASFLSDNRVIFNIRGNHYRLVVKVRYQNGIVVVEWVGTHADYDKQDF